VTTGGPSSEVAGAESGGPEHPERAVPLAPPEPVARTTLLVAAAPQRRSWLEIRWRQFRNAPRPVFRAVAASLGVATVLGLLYLTYDIALTRGAQLPGGDLRVLAVALDVLAVLVVGSFVTWLIVPLPRGSKDVEARPTRTRWSAALGLFAAIPIAYLVLVAVTQILKPLLV
jgi:hypothetical protein